VRGTEEIEMLDPEVVKRTIGKRSEPIAIEYGWKDVVLYALGIGAQVDELQFLYENVAGGLKVFPSFGVLMAAGQRAVLAELNLYPPKNIHGEHCLRLHRLFPPEGRLLSVSEVVNIYDKRKAAVITVRTDVSTESGDLVCENEAILFYLGGGGFGGEPGPKSERASPPEDVDPDFRIAYAVPENQAALYRLNGDYNPLHIDAESAKDAGFDEPILHGLCTFGYATRAILCGACDGDMERFKEFKVRFSAPVLPGDTLTTEGGKGQDGRYAIRASTERGAVLSNAYAVVGN
jgi:acyl dehydratase